MQAQLGQLAGSSSGGNDMSWTGRLRQFFRRDQDDAKKQARRVARAQQKARIVAERGRAEGKIPS